MTAASLFDEASDRVEPFTESDAQRWARYRRDLLLIVASRFPGEEAR